MHEQLKELIDYTKEKFNLTEFHLKRHQLFKEKDHLDHVSYMLNMEWFPNGTAEESEDINPPGTVSIDIDFHTRRLKSLIFVEGINLLETDLPTREQVERAIEWVEEETGLEFGRQFKLKSTDGPDLFFHAAVDNIPVYPAGFIELEFNEAGKISLFSTHGNFPDEAQISWEPFALTEAEIEEIVKGQLTRLEVPVIDEEKWRNVYAISSCFITNREKEVLSYENVESGPTYILLNEVLEWESGETETFETKEIDQSTDTTIEAALANSQEQIKPLTEKEQQIIISRTTAYLQSLKPVESGTWKLTSIQRDADYIFAVLRLAAEESRVLNRKLTIVLESESLEPINHIDNLALIDAFQNFTEAEDAKVTEKEAFDRLINYIEVTPVYVFDQKNDQYILCGKVDSSLAVDAVTGEILEIEALN